MRRARSSSARRRRPAVTVAYPVKRTIVDHDEYVGRFVAIDSVEVRARVSGYLEKMHFTDGQLVKEGDLLFTIDRRPFQNALDQARANLAQARANLAYAEADLIRGQQLVRDKTITEQTFEQRRRPSAPRKPQSRPTKRWCGRPSSISNFTELRAPVAGRIGDRRVSPGNLVTGGLAGNTTLLATIVSTDPIRFEFTFDEASYLRYERARRRSNRRSRRARRLDAGVMLKLIDEKDFTHAGRMDFIDNVIDRAYRHDPRPRGVRQRATAC